MQKNRGETGPKTHRSGRKRPARPPITEKKANGEGTVYYDKHKGGWFAAITIGQSPNGRPRIKKLPARTKSEALELRRKLHADKQNHRLVEPSRMTLRELSGEWLAQRLLIRSSTRGRSEQHLQHVLDLIGDRKIQSIGTGDIVAVLNQLNTKQMAHGGTMARISLKHVRTQLWAVFEYAREGELIRKNPVARSTRIAGADGIGGRPLTAAQVRRLCEVGEAFHRAGLLRLWPAIVVALRTGMRRGELCALTWEDIDFTEQVIRVRRALTRVNAAYVVSDPKTQSSKRDLPMHITLPGLLQQHQQEQQQQFKASGLRWTRHTPVFATEQGQHTSPDNLFRSLRLLITWSDPAQLRPTPGEPYIWRGIKTDHRADLMSVVASGEALPVISPHDLRHTYATLMLVNRVSVEVVSRLLGHAGAAITLHVYRKVFRTELDVARHIDITADVG